MPNRVFISYRHESPQHASGVRQLGDLLRQAKLPVALDQFLLQDQPGGPDVGWPKWSEDCANESACVLVVASRGWFDAYANPNPEVALGMGVATEAALFRQELWDKKRVNDRIRLVFIDDLPFELVPQGLRAWEVFRPFEGDAQRDQLVRWAADTLGLARVDLPSVVWPEPLPFVPDLADRYTEWPAIVELLAGRSRERILAFEGASGLGKSALVREATSYAKKLGVRVVRVDFKAVVDVAGVLGQFDLDLGGLLPSFARDGAGKTLLLRKDLRALRQPVLLVFDSYDRQLVDNKPLADWLSQNLLAEVETARALATIVSGQAKPQFEAMGWRDLVRHLALKPITEARHWEAWIDRRYPDFRKKGAHLPTVLMAASGNPAVVAVMCETIARS